ncbi:hypothetical protein V6N12_068023 [Hibiscus sabdariffa]|uniref:Uncharacterized protein n=1 Tax=Hibiscus sabdariffa TaxID=183260 RepID=A0ABR2FNT0_9ROSI
MGRGCKLNDGGDIRIWLLELRARPREVRVGGMASYQSSLIFFNGVEQELAPMKGVHMLNVAQHESGVAPKVSIVPNTKADVVTMFDAAETVHNNYSTANTENLKSDVIVAA